MTVNGHGKTRVPMKFSTRHAEVTAVLNIFYRNPANAFFDRFGASRNGKPLSAFKAIAEKTSQF